MALSFAVGAIGVAKTVSFDWAFVKRSGDGATEAVDFSQHVDIKQGDLFKIYIRPSPNTYVYVFLYDASNKLQVIFPNDFKVFDVDARNASEYFIPKGANWFTLDNTRGTERFYLVASAVRLRHLESLVDVFQRVTSVAKPRRNAVAKAQAAVLNELVSLRQLHSDLRSIAETPVTIAGATRGLDQQVRDLATHIEAADFYAKTFRLEH